MPRPLKFPTKVLIGFDDPQIEAIDEWRRRQPDLPTRSEAIRRLIGEALKLKAKKAGRKPAR